MPCDRLRPIGTQSRGSRCSCPSSPFLRPRCLVTARCAVPTRLGMRACSQVSGVRDEELLDFYRGLSIKLATHMARLATEALRIGQLKARGPPNDSVL